MKPNTSRPLRFRRRVAGLSLLELLVVIGIIGVLLGLLFPIVGRARDSARTVVCLANLRSVGQGFGLYRAKYANLMPPLYLSHPDLPPPTSRWESHFQYGSRTSGAYTWNWADVLVSEQFITLATIDCPASDGTGTLGDNREAWTTRAIDYSMNGYIGIGSGRLIGLKTEPSPEVGLNYHAMTIDPNWSMFKAWPIARITQPSSGLCVVDSEAPGYARPHVDPTISEYKPKRLRHQGRQAVNVLFFDGHAETRVPALVTSPRDAIFDNASFSPGKMPGSLYSYIMVGGPGTDHHEKLRQKMPTALWRPWKPYF